MSYRCIGNVVAGRLQMSRPACWIVRHGVPVAAKALDQRLQRWKYVSSHLVLVPVNADVCEAIGGGHDGHPVLVRLERLLQVHHRGGGEVAPGLNTMRVATQEMFCSYKRMSTWQPHILLGRTHQCRQTRPLARFDTNIQVGYPRKQEFHIRYNKLTTMVENTDHLL